jgi:hypothetical protein
LTAALHCTEARCEEAPLQPVVSARLELTLPDDCGTPEQFLNRVRVRSGRIRFSPDETTLFVRAGLFRKKSGLIQAQMTLFRPGGDDATRTIEAGNCDEALEGLALLTAVTLDPTSVSRALTDTAEPPEPSETPPAPPPPTKPPEPAPQSLPAPTPQVPPADSYVGVSLLALGTHGTAPAWMAGMEGGFEWAQFSHSLLAPAIRLAVSYQARNNISAIGGKADFKLTTGTLDLCPVNARGPVDMRLCGQATAGLMRSEGSDTVAPETHARPWFSLGAAAEISVPLSRTWALPLRGALQFPLVRDRYQFAPSAFYETPTVALGVSAGLKAQFW